MDSILEFAHKRIKEIVREKDIVIDATCGNGYDTIFLASICKKVYAFDRQKEAIQETKEKTKEFSNVEIIWDSHTRIDKYVKEKIKAIMFNLGYLPNSDKKETTKVENTTEAIKKGLYILDDEGIMTIVCYTGHYEGEKEANEIGEMLKKLDQKAYQVLKYEFINQINSPPILYIVEKI